MSNIVTFPEVWDELTTDDFTAMLRLRENIIKHPDKSITVDDVRIEAARCLLLNRGIRTRLSNDKYFLLVHQCAASLQWLWQSDDSGALALVYRSTFNLLPRWRQLYGPRSHGADLDFGEFKEAVAICIAYDADPQHPFQLLQQLAGLLYRRRNRKTLRRTPYDAEPQPTQLDRGQRLPSWFVWGVYAWFSFFCEYLATGIFIIDGREVSFAPVFASNVQHPTSSLNPPPSLGLNAIALTLAESRVFGSFDDVLHTSLLRVMMKLLHDQQTLHSAKLHKP